MLRIESDKTIKLTRGDTAYLTVDLTNGQGIPYELKPDDILTFSVKRQPKTDVDCLIQKTITGENSFHLEPLDTKNLSFGKYKYDIQLTTSSGDVFTVIEPSTFEIMEEVTT